MENQLVHIDLTDTQKELFKISIPLTPQQKQHLKATRGIEVNQIEVPVKLDESREVSIVSHLKGGLACW